MTFQNALRVVLAATWLSACNAELPEPKTPAVNPAEKGGVSAVVKAGEAATVEVTDPNSPIFGASLELSPGALPPGVESVLVTLLPVGDPQPLDDSISSAGLDLADGVDTVGVYIEVSVVNAANGEPVVLKEEAILTRPLPDGFDPATAPLLAMIHFHDAQWQPFLSQDFNAGANTISGGLKTFSQTAIGRGKPVHLVSDVGFVTTEDTVLTGTLTASRTGILILVTPPAKGTAVLANAVRGIFRYTPHANVSGVDTFVYRIGKSQPATVTISVTPVNDPPTITLNQTGFEIGTGETAVVDAGLSHADVDNANFTSASVSITGFGSGDALLFTAQNGITGAFSAGVLSLSGTASLAHYQAALRSVQFQAGTVAGARAFQILISDGAASVSAARAATVVAVANTAPVMVHSAGYLKVFGIEVPKPIVPFYLRAADSENAAGQIYYTLVTAPAAGALQLSNVTLAQGATFTQDDVNRLRLRYVLTSDVAGDFFAVALSDIQGNTAGTYGFDVTRDAANTAPVNGFGNAFAYGDGGVAPLRNVFFTDNEQVANELIYTLETPPAVGHLMGPSGQLTTGSQFTQAEVDNAFITYVYPAGTTAQVAMSVTVSDGMGGAAGPATFYAFYSQPSGAGTPPTVVSQAGGAVAAGNELTLTLAMLDATDTEAGNMVVFMIDTAPTRGTLRFKYTAPGDGNQLQLGKLPLIAGDRFTRGDIQSGRISYLPAATTAATSDAFGFTVLDGTTDAHTAGEISLSIFLAPVKVNSGGTITMGGRLVLAPQDLLFSDADSVPEEIVYTYAGFPSPFRLGSGTDPLASFTQAQVNAGEIQLVENSAYMTTYSVGMYVEDENGVPSYFSFTVNCPTCVMVMPPCMPMCP